MPIRIQRKSFGRKLLQRVMVGAALFWRHLEERWEENPGYFAATTAGTIGILLALLLIINAGIDWINGPPVDPNPAVAESDEDDLGDPDADLMRGLRSDDDDPPARYALRRDELDDDLGEAGDPFLKPRKADRWNDDDTSDEPVADEPEEDRPAPRVSIAETAPRQKAPIEEEEKVEEETEEPEPATRPTLKLEIGRLDVQTEDEETVTQEMAADDSDYDQTDAPDLKLADDEPVFLKTNGERDAEPERSEAKRRIEADDDTIREQPPIRRSEKGWQRQRPAADPPAVSTRKSRTAETVVVAPRESQPARRTTESTPAKRPVRAPQEPAADSELKMSISGPANVGLDESCSYVLSVTNTGTTTARNLVVSIELPRGLVHEVSQSIEQDVASIPPGGTHRSLLKLTARQPGESLIQAEVLSGRRAAAKLTAHVKVGPTGTARRVVISDSLCDDLR